MIYLECIIFKYIALDIQLSNCLFFKIQFLILLRLYQLAPISIFLALVTIMINALICYSRMRHF